MNIRFAGSAVLAALTLAACNNISSEAPLFARDDVARTPVLRAGMWGVRKEGCALTASGRQPNGCTPPIEISADLVGDPAAGGIPYILSDGSPPVIQLSVPDQQTRKTTYYYWAVEPIARDAGGRVTEAWIWPVQCGPLAPAPEEDSTAAETSTSAAEPATRTPIAPPDGEATTRQGGGGDIPGAAPDPGKPEAPGETPDTPGADDALAADLFEQLMAAMMTREPYEGLTMTPIGCTASQAAPVLGAAKASSEWYAHKIQFYWVGEKGTMVAAAPRLRGPAR